MMVIAIGNDHVALDMKNHIKAYLENQGHAVIDCGTHTAERTDYPLYAERVARKILAGEAVLGVLICGTGIGISMAANKIKGIRAAVCSEPYSAALTRAHNNANIIAFGARVIGIATAETIVDAFLGANFEGGRHAGRVDMMTVLESGGTLCSD